MSCHQILGDMIWWPTQDLVAVYTCSTGTGRVLGCRIGSAQWNHHGNHDTSYMHLREEKKKCTKFSTYRVYDSCMTAVRDTCWPRKTYPRTYRPASALFFEFWRLAVDVLIVLSVGIRRTQQLDQLRGTCSHLCHACMHFGHWQWMTLTCHPNCSVSLFWVSWQKKIHVYILDAQNT